VAAPFHFDHLLAFEPARASEILRQVPNLPGVFGLFAPRIDGQPEAQPYLTRAADLRRRITRLLAPPDSQTKRLNLSERVARIEYTVTGSEFESTLILYHASADLFGFTEARRRLRLHTPYFLRFAAENPFPRVYSTNRLSKRAMANTYGPFPSRAAADRYCDAVLDLFKLRRCYEDLAPAPDHPGCVYGEMGKCLAPCNQAHTPSGSETYSAEAAKAKRFFDTRGESMIVDIGLEREEASAAMEFERAAQLHAQWHKVKAAQALADELVQPIPKLRAVIVQKSAAITPTKLGAPGLAAETWAGAATSPANAAEPTAAIFLLQSGCITGPAPLSTLGVRAVKEQTSVGSSLFAQPLMLQAIPLQESPTPNSVTGSPTPNSVVLSGDATPLVASESKDPEAADVTHTSDAILPANSAATSTSALNPESRATALIAALEEKASVPTDLATLSDHLSLLRRWYYRPEKQRTGEIFFPNANGAAAEEKPAWPIRRILRGAARMALGEPAPMAETQRDLAQRNPEDTAQKPTRTKILHEGRPNVERIVHVIDPPPPPPTFTSRRRSQPK
jgi:excinuclease ABC subunit C